jgi:prophage maintenance system killer protein
LPNEPLWLAEGHVILANQKISKRLGLPFFVRHNEAALGRALERPKALWRFGDTNVANAGSTLILEIGRNNPFEIANSETAFASCCLFLRANGYTFVPKESPIVSQFVKRAISKTLTLEHRSDELFYLTMRRCIWPTHEIL